MTKGSVADRFSGQVYLYYPAIVRHGPPISKTGIYDRTKGTLIAYIGDKDVKIPINRVVVLINNKQIVVGGTVDSGEIDKEKKLLRLKLRDIFYPLKQG
jgi:hypothetical protein